MSYKILHGKPVSEHVKNGLRNRIKKLKVSGCIPKLAAIIVGNDPASKIYVNTKHKTFMKFDCLSEVHSFSNDANENEISDLIKKLNLDEKVHGILLQLPLPKHLNSKKILDCISPNKDVDGLHPMNLGNLIQGNPCFIPCTPLGCLEILKYYKINVESKHIVIVGRSNLVGKPLMSLLSQKFKIGNATVTICHTGTKDISYHTKQADVLIAAVGVPNFINNLMIKNKSIIIDVGINRINDNSKKGYHIVGDVDYNTVISKVDAITPVPGGVGPMTISMLLSNTVTAAEKISVN